MVLSEWEEHTAASGRKYWFNTSRNISTYEKPQLPPGQEFRIIDKRGFIDFSDDSEVELMLPSPQEVQNRFGLGWSATFDVNTGRTYVFNRRSGEREWWPERRQKKRHSHHLEYHRDRYKERIREIYRLYHGTKTAMLDLFLMKSSTVGHERKIYRDMCKILKDTGGDLRALEVYLFGKRQSGDLEKLEVFLFGKH